MVVSPNILSKKLAPGMVYDGACMLCDGGGMLYDGGDMLYTGDSVVYTGAGVLYTDCETPCIFIFII